MTLEVDHLLRVIFAGRRKTGQLDLEAVEMAIRSLMHHAAATGLTELLQYDPPEAGQRTVACPCGQTAQYLELRSKPILTVVGTVELLRPYYLCSHCHQGQFPVDAALDVESSELSPGVRRMLAVVGSEAPFDQGREQLRLLADLTVTTKAVERTAEAMGEDMAARQAKKISQAMQLDLPMAVGPSIPVIYVQIDGTGVPVVSAETQGRTGKVEGQPAHTREAKLGCVFTQTSVDGEGRPVREEDSTTYVGAIETAEQFGRRIYTEAWHRGWARAEKKVVMGDGAEWIWNIAEQHFPGAIPIVDLYHARQHLWELAAKLYPNDSPHQNRWMMTRQDKLDNGRIESLVASLRSLATSHPGLAEQIRTEADYFQKNAERMRYPAFRRQKLFVGTGVIEAGCKMLIGARLKQSGMFWTVRGANAIIALRCCRLSGRFEDYWEARRA
jgi:hypothetical protein